MGNNDRPINIFDKYARKEYILNSWKDQVVYLQNTGTIPWDINKFEIESEQAITKYVSDIILSLMSISPLKKLITVIHVINNFKLWLYVRYKTMWCLPIPQG